MGCGYRHLTIVGRRPGHLVLFSGVPWVPAHGASTTHHHNNHLHVEHILFARRSRHRCSLFSSSWARAQLRTFWSFGILRVFTDWTGKMSTGIRVLVCLIEGNDGKGPLTSICTSMQKYLSFGELISAARLDVLEEASSADRFVHGCSTTGSNDCDVTLPRDDVPTPTRPPTTTFAITTPAANDVTVGSASAVADSPPQGWA